MSLVRCPHCGLQNFTISAYCRRCERPMGRGAASPVAWQSATRPAATPTRAAAPAGPAQTPPRRPTQIPQAPATTVAFGGAAAAAVQREPVPESLADAPPEPGHHALPSEADAAGLDSVDRSPRRRPGRRASSSTHGIEAVESQTPLPDALPPPPPPPAPEAARPAPLPIELATGGNADGRKGRAAKQRRPGELLADDLEEGQTEVPVRVPGLGRLFLSWLVDSVVVAAVGLGVGVAQMLALGPQWPPPGYTGLDYTAELLALHPNAAALGSLAALGFAVVYAVLAGRGGGRTLGRRLAGTVLVRPCGGRLTWLRVAGRTLGGVASFALFGAGYFCCLLDRNHRTWHDRVCDTVVVIRRVQLFVRQDRR